MSEKVDEDQTYLLNHLMEKQFIYKIVLISLQNSGLNQKEMTKLEEKLQKKAFEATRILNSFSKKNKLNLMESLYIIDALYRTATWRMYEDWGHLKEKILEPEKERESYIGYG